MRIWTTAAAAALALSAFAPAPAAAMEQCWPMCVFNKPSAGSNSGQRAAGTKSSQQQRASGSSSGSSSGPSYSGGGGSTGVASYYWQPQRVASGGWFDPNAMTAAHKTLPFGTKVRVTHLGNGRTVDVTINDRGPFVGGRVIDLSKAAAGVIGMQSQGIASVRVDVIGR